MNVFQYIAALDSMMDAHKAGVISNENLTLGTAMVVELYAAQPKAAQHGIKLDSPRFFAPYTAEQFVNSPAFLATALPDAVRVVAKANGQSAETTALAFNMGVPNVVNQVAKLIAKAAQHCADEANAGRL